MESFLLYVAVRQKLWMRLATTLLIGVVSALVLDFSKESAVGWALVPALAAAILLGLFSSLARTVTIRDENVIYQFKVTELLEKFRTEQAVPGGQFDTHAFNSLQNIINILSSTLSAELKESCSVSIKLLWTNPQGRDDVPVVHTLLRDSRSAQERVRFSPDDFPLNWNSAFLDIATQVEGDFYTDSNLMLRAAKNRYDNINSNWPRLYNSTAVKAIGLKSSEQRCLIGFVCVDAWYASFSKPKIEKIIAHVAEYISVAMQLIYLNQHESLAGSVDATGARIGWEEKDGRFVAVANHQVEFEARLRKLQATNALRVKAPNFVGLDLEHFSETSHALYLPASGRPGSAMTMLTPRELQSLQTRRRRDPDYAGKLLKQAADEFDAQWGIDPASKTDYERRI